MNKYIIPATLIGTGMVFIFLYIERRKEVSKLQHLYLKPKTEGAVEALKKANEAVKKKVAETDVIFAEDYNFATHPHPLPSTEPTNRTPIMVAEHKPKMKDSERRELIERVKAMSREELELVAEIIPVDLCLKRIDAELQKAKEFEKSIKSAMNGLTE